MSFDDAILGFAVGWALVIIFVGVVLLLGNSASLRNTFVGKMRNSLLSLPANLGYLACLCVSGCNKQRASARYDRLSNYLLNQRNPVMQISYCVLVLPVMYQFHIKCIPYFETWPDRIFWSAYCALGLFSFLLASYAKPGVVGEPGTSAQDARFAADGILYATEGEDCRTCKVPRPARSKHCRLCGHCVRRYDHHCSWLNVDIGELNYRWFHMFLVVHWSLCGIGCWRCCRFVNSKIDWTELNWVRDPVTHEVVPYNFLHVLVIVAQQEPVILYIICFTAVVSGVLLGFWTYHMILVYRNTTNNEAMKIRDVLDYCQGLYNLKCTWTREVERIKQLPVEQRLGEVCEWRDITDAQVELYVQRPKFSDPQKIRELYLYYERLVDVENVKPRKARAKIQARLRKIYRKSFLSNINEVLFPTAWRKSK